MATGDHTIRKLWNPAAGAVSGPAAGRANRQPPARPLLDQFVRPPRPRDRARHRRRCVAVFSLRSHAMQYICMVGPAWGRCVVQRAQLLLACWAAGEGLVFASFAGAWECTCASGPRSRQVTSKTCVVGRARGSHFDSGNVYVEPN